MRMVNCVNRGTGNYDDRILCYCNTSEFFAPSSTFSFFNKYFFFFQSDTIYHRRGSVTVTEYVVPTCSYRMGTNRMGAAIAVLGKAEKIR